MTDIQGKKTKTVRWIHTARCVVRVEVDAVILEDDPSEPCFDAQTVKWLDEVRRRAEQGDVAWLEKIGVVYLRESA